jgi:predicted transcriptional regulator
MAPLVPPTFLIAPRRACYYTAPVVTRPSESADRPGPSRQAKLATGELEAGVLDVLWASGGWLTPGEVHQALSSRRSLAYTTVMTILVRLWRKGRLDRHRDGRAYAYRPVQSREEVAAARMGEVLTGVQDRPRALSHFLEALDASDRAQLRRMLKSHPEH